MNTEKHARIGGASKKVILGIFDLLCMAIVGVVYLFFAHFTKNSPFYPQTNIYLLNMLLQFATIFFVRVLFHSYKNILRYASLQVYLQMFAADILGTVLALFLIRLVAIFIPSFYLGVWHTVTVGLSIMVLFVLSRMGYAMIYRLMKNNAASEPDKRMPVAIIGANSSGVSLLEQLRNNRRSPYIAKFFVDIDKEKIGNVLSGLTIFSPDQGDSAIAEEKISTVIIVAKPEDEESKTNLYNHYKEMGCTVKVYDSPIHDEDVAEKNRGVVRDFSIEDLLFRKAKNFSDESVVSFYRGKTVLVTGGGGSIGSEICRQLAKMKLSRLVIFDIYENNAYEIQQELLQKYGRDFPLSVEIGSVRDRDCLEMVFSRFRPQIVFHAAAHKHVPLMENSGAEAIKNNVFGTKNTADMAEKYGAEKFILISTDKAVNPTNVMGASKRMCEMVVQCRTDSQTSFAAVRFGNVLGSNGSVIPLFRKQIAAGGPVTITDKRIIRYFMTIPEASQLVMKAGAMAKRGELFVLDMGKPVKIYDLAVNMIRLSGLEPDRDIEIREIGLRPGEKLYEELLIQTEHLGRTENDMIFVEHDEPLSREEVDSRLQRLKEAVADAQAVELDSEAYIETVKEAVREAVPTYHTPDSVNGKAEAIMEKQLAGEKR